MALPFLGDTMEGKVLDDFWVIGRDGKPLEGKEKEDYLASCTLKAEDCELLFLEDRDDLTVTVSYKSDERSFNGKEEST